MALSRTITLVSIFFLWSLVSLVPHKADAAIAVRQTTPQQNAECVASDQVTLSSLPLAGSTIVIPISFFNAVDITSVTDNQGNTYSQATAPALGSSASVAYIYYKSNIAAPSGSFIITVTTSGCKYFEWTVSEVTGLAAAPLDKAMANAGAGVSFTSGSVGPTAATEQANEIVFAAISIQNSAANNAMSTPGVGYTELYVQNNTNSFQGGEAGYKILSSVGAQTASWTWANNADYSAMIATFKGSTGGATLSKPPNKLGLVGYWRFDEGTGTIATDFSGNGNTGTLTNGPTWANGKLGRAISFDGTDDFVNVGSGSTVNLTGAMTVCAWFMTSDTVGTGTIVARANSGATNYQYRLAYSPTGDGTGGQALFGWTNDSSSEEFYEADLALKTGVWVHMCGVRTAGGVGSIYVDGTSSSVTPTGDFAVSTGAGNTSIGRFGDSDLNYYPSRLDEVRLYNRQLGATEIRYLYGSGAVRIGASSADLDNGSTVGNNIVGHWTMDGSDSQLTITDRSGGGNHGYFIGGATSSAKIKGKLGQALDFDGTDDVVTVTSEIVGAGDATICAWINPDSYGEGTLGRIFDNGKANMYVISSINSVRFSSDDVTNASAADGAITLGVWQHVCASRNSSGTANIYINGSLSSTANQASGTPAAGTGLKIGNRTAADRTFDGKIDDVRIYNRVLTAAEAKQLYQLGAFTVRN